MISNDKKDWINSIGESFMKEIGVKKKQFLLDFGCGEGIYTFPASYVVGKMGRVYAVDKDKDILSNLREKNKEYNLCNIELILVEEESKLSIPNEWLDIVLLYDVLHLVENKKNLLYESYRILKPGGILSVYPRHHLKHMNMELDEVQKLVELYGFRFETKLFKLLMHNSSLEKDYVLNFKKSDQGEPEVDRDMLLDVKV